MADLAGLGKLIAEAAAPAVIEARVARGAELVITARREALLPLMALLKTDTRFAFEQCMDICGVDHPERAERFEVVYNLLSLSLNQRVRVKVATDEDHPVPSVTGVWSAAGWFEREAWDLYGIYFSGHPDLRRILTDYGFIGHPFRKDFPISGNVEMRYDPEKGRVIYQPVTVEPREITPRIIREEQYGNSEGFRKG